MVSLEFAPRPGSASSFRVRKLEGMHLNSLGEFVRSHFQGFHSNYSRIVGVDSSAIHQRGDLGRVVVGPAWNLCFFQSSGPASARLLAGRWGDPRTLVLAGTNPHCLLPALQTAQKSRAKQSDSSLPHRLKSAQNLNS